jgi:Protein of unknown function (DUF2795)
MSAPNPIQLQKFLSGVNYPASRDELVEHARRQGADEEVLRRLDRIPNRTYDGPNAVSAEFAKN